MKKTNLVTIGLALLLSCHCFAKDKVPDEPYAVDANMVNQPAQHKTIDPLSVRVLYLILLKGNSPLVTATGFVVQKEKTNYLITNWHVLTGRHPATNRPTNPTEATPTHIMIWHNGPKLGTWVRSIESLYDKKGKKRWLEHKQGQKVDVVALPLQSTHKDARLYPLDLSMADHDMQSYVAMNVSIIGYPLGFAGPGLFPIWKTGHIASEPDLDYNKEPLFLIDATTRGGMSGSPVVARQAGAYLTRGGDIVLSTGISTRFLGIYSGRLPGDSEIGRVWRPKLVSEILNQKQ